MYTRPYGNESGIVIPERYGGTSFGAQTSDEVYSAPPHATDSEKDYVPTSGSVHTEKVGKSGKDGSPSSFLSKLPFSDFFTKITKNDFFSLQNIGKEEILIIAAAAFLFFSKEGDRECAIMLLLLLFFK